MQKRFVLLAAWGLAACGSSTPATTVQTISDADAKTKASAIVAGAQDTTIERVAATADEPALAVVKCKMPNGASINVELVEKDGSLQGIASEVKPFDGYDLTPKEGVLKYSVAKSDALENKAGTVEAWEFSNPKSIWEFYIRDNNEHLWEVKLNAADGKLSSVIEKAVRD